MPKILDLPPRGLRLIGLTKRYGQELAVDDLSLSVAAGEFLTLLGPSGSGKTTTLNMVAGFIAPTSGHITMGDDEISTIPSHRRNIGVVFQDYALFPHMTVFENVAFPLCQRRVKGRDLRDGVGEALELVRLAGMGGKYPGQLSGGQRQRVAIARSVASRPSVLLMDEPMGALDRTLREALQIEMKRIHRELGITFIHVTHDQEEALSMSDRVAVMRGGRLEQVGSPRELYEEPRSVFVAGFIGDANVLRGTFERVGDSAVLVDRGRSLPVEASKDGRSGSQVGVLIRPEQIRLVGGEMSGEAIAEGLVREVIYLGAMRKIVVDLDHGPDLMISEAAAYNEIAVVGARVGVTWNAEDARVLPGAGAEAGQESAHGILSEGPTG